MPISSCDNCGAPLNAVPWPQLSAVSILPVVSFPTQEQVWRRFRAANFRAMPARCAPIRWWRLPSKASKPLVRELPRHSSVAAQLHAGRGGKSAGAMHRKGYDVDEVAEVLDITPRRLQLSTMQKLHGGHTPTMAPARGHRYVRGLPSD
jgi:hypothetical protein